VQIGNYNLWGGRSQCLPWSIENGYLVGRNIESGDNCYVGTNSTVLGGVTLEDHATVAGFSIASEDVAGTQTVIGSNVITTNLETNGTHTDSFTNLEIASHIAGLVLWVGAALVTGVVLAVIGDSVVVDSVYAVCIACLAFGATPCLLLPLYVIGVLITSKYLFVGKFVTSEINLQSRSAIPYTALVNINNACWDILRLAVGGTFVEITFYKLMGATIDPHVFLDTVYIFEADLVSIGSHSSIGMHSALSPHQITRTTAQFAKLKIGERCSTGVNACLHGRDVLEDDTSMMSGKTMGLIGTRMKGGNWSGYPAKLQGPVFQPLRPSQPAWYVLLLNPAGYGLLCHHRHKLTFTNGNVEDDRPPHFCGVFKAGSLPLKVRLDRGLWVPHLRLLKLEARTYAESDGWFRGYGWCRWASYSLDFDSTLNEAEGQLSFGSWRVPSSIVSVRLRRVNDGWFVGHYWFRGDPTTEIFLSRES
jgi:carbonic anhydrase/acetyltransferase-like protein (isoleucine patch superfamily)